MDTNNIRRNTPTIWNIARNIKLIDSLERLCFVTLVLGAPLKENITLTYKISNFVLKHNVPLKIKEVFLN